ncbi:zf-HC2 domain-containing protein [Candidatus Peregrinibacteria bacterium]|nr:zf-HC2 domain-containing protein [Candidatus Peregrinibacteria bacterium]
MLVEMVNDGENMKCDEMKELVTLYAGGELMPEEVTLVDSHIASCKPCREEVEEYRVIAKKLSALKEEPVSDDLWDDMWSGIKEGISREKKVIQFDMILKYAAMLLLGLGVGFIGYIFNRGQDSEIGATAEQVTAKKMPFAESIVARKLFLPNEVCPVDNKLGVAVSNVSQSDLARLNIPGGGIQIKGILEGSVAQNILGLQPNDIVVKFDEKAIKDLDGFRKIVDEINKTGKLNMTLTVVRDGKVTNINVSGDFEGLDK